MNEKAITVNELISNTWQKTLFNNNLFKENKNESLKS